MKKCLARLLLLPALLASLAQAESPEELIRAKLKAVLPDAQIVAITPIPVSGFAGGLYQVRSRNYETVMATGDGRYLIQGEVLEVRDGDLVDVSEQVGAASRGKALAQVKPEDMVIFPAVGKAKRTLYVFTDVDCGYCRKFHAQVPELNKRGVEVRYLAFPRGGLSSPVAGKLTSVWCAADRQRAMTEAKRGAQLAATPSLCKAPIKAEYELGVELGVRGTPAVFADDGMQLGGYVPADKLVKMLKLP